MPTPLGERKAVSGRPLWQGRSGVAGVPSSGHASKGILQEPKRAPHLLPHREERLLYGRYVTPRETGGTRRDAEQSYDPILPVKVGNRRASARSGHGTYWREGGNKRTYLPKET